jgi:DNA-binding beta-propeller fold protein YncE
MNRRGNLALVVGFGIACALGHSVTACYSTGDGTKPPPTSLYYPVGLAVSQAGNVLYAVNSDFDLQWNGGTVQSYDLQSIRQHAAVTATGDQDLVVRAGVPLTRPLNGQCPQDLPEYTSDQNGKRQPLGETCAPPVDSRTYVKDWVTIGAFATDLQLASWTKNRIFIPVRGDASLTWMDVVPDTDQNAKIAFDHDAPDASSPFYLNCDSRVDNRCNAAHHAGSPNDKYNTRHAEMPGEPFGIAQSEDGAFLLVTHQNETKVSLFSSGLAPNGPGAGFGQAPTDPCGPAPAGSAADRDYRSSDPSLQFVAENIPVGGNGVVAIPHDPCAYWKNSAAAPAATTKTQPLPRPAFLETSRAVAELGLIRLYPDEGLSSGGDFPWQSDQKSSVYRPYVIREGGFPLTANASGVDSRGIVIDDTPRRACKARVNADTSLSEDQKRDARAECARKPARVFFANRSPASLLVGEIGETSARNDGTYDADRLVVFKTVPLTFGPSKLYLAPIVDKDGNYALRVFVVCFDSQTIFIWDPEAGQMENIIRVGQGPFAMAFDPFDLDDVAQHKPAPLEPPAREPTDTNGSPLRGANEPPLLKHKYRFAYIANFTTSFVQAIDLDNTIGDRASFERVVYTLGLPTLPKGSQ